MKIAVVGFQGDVSEHVTMLARIFRKLEIDGDVVLARRVDDIRSASGIIIPGGESTTIYKLTKQFGLYDEIIRSGHSGVPVMGTCAGLILISRETNDDRVKGMGLLDIEVKRNAYGRQIDSFIDDIDVNGIGRFPAVFIRAPVISNPGTASVMAMRNNEVVMVKQDNVIGMTFHPELTDDTRIHEYFISMVEGERYISTGR